MKDLAGNLVGNNMGVMTKGGIQSKNGQFIFNSRHEFEKNREYLINELLKSDIVGEDELIGTAEEKMLAKLFQNSPNPFEKKSTIKVEIYEKCNIELKVLAISGNELLTLANGVYENGVVEFEINSNRFSPGIYFYTLNINGLQSDTRKMIIY